MIVYALNKMMCLVLAGNDLFLAGYLGMFWYLAGKWCDISGIDQSHKIPENFAQLPAVASKNPVNPAVFQ